MAQKKNVKETNVVTKPVDPVQRVANDRLEEYGKKLEGKGRPILYGVLALIAIAIIGGIIYSYSRRSAAAAQTALGNAIEVHTAQVSASPIPNNPKPTFATEKERSEKAIAAFEDVAGKYSGDVREKAQYFIAVNRVKIDREAGIKELDGLTKSGNREVATLAKFALAETKAADGKYDEAATLYNDLLQQKTGIIADKTLNFALAQVYEKQGKKNEAADIYFNLAKAAREAKDSDGKPVPVSQTAREAATKLEKLDSAKFKQLPAEPSLAGL